MSAVIVNNIIKRYGSKKAVITALQGVSFDVKQGELFGIIGPDGAGKTSLFRILTTLLLADEGTATVDGFDVVKDYKSIRQRVGYIYSQIEPFKERKAGKLSGGMKQKLALSCALIHRPSVLFLDEPTTGVDAVSRKEFWEMLTRLKEQGITILVSTPYMDEASLCDRVALIQSGKILSINTPQGIVDSFGKKLLAVKSNDMLHLLEQKGYLFKLKEAKPNIEDCFMALMKTS